MKKILDYLIDNTWTLAGTGLVLITLSGTTFRQAMLLTGIAVVIHSVLTFKAKDQQMKKAQDITQRLIALFMANALAIITGSAIVGGIPVWKAAALAGFTAVAQVAEKLARASVDGNLSTQEISDAFGGNGKKVSE